jgi:hypothetical protein
LILSRSRLFFSLFTVSTLATMLHSHLLAGYTAVNFFSYFTNLSNLFAAVVLTFSVIPQRLKIEPQNLIWLRGQSVTCMILVALIYNLLLRDIDLGGLKPWMNMLIHIIMPFYVFIDWYLSPSRAIIPLKLVYQWLIAPAIYLIYTLAHGTETGWYPYPFFNPELVGGFFVRAVANRLA